jgi:hypothetical protein
MNFINCKSAAAPEALLDIYTTRCQGSLAPFVPGAVSDRIFRFGAKKSPGSAIGRAFHYLRFNASTLWRLIRTRPGAVIYFESISAFPAFVYKKFINRRSRLFLHYHEYMTPQEYEHGMRMVRAFHRLERRLYGHASWVSHTNAGRMQRFVNDLNNIPVPNRNILPNYPPKSWQSGHKKSTGRPLKVVYIGSLSLDTMYTREFATWVVAQQGRVRWDIYSQNVVPEAAAFVQTLPPHLVRLHPAVNYADIPDILKQYELGVILYTGHIPNWVDVAPNKLFEYLACGLDVWLPMNMTGSLAYVTSDTYPKVTAVDFSRLDRLDPDAVIDKTGLTYSQPAFYCEEIYRPLWNLIANK